MGVLGAVAWIALSTVQREIVAHTQIEWLKSLGERSAFNPLAQLARSAAMLAYGFLAVRFFGLGIVVPMIEEFFLRGFLMRFVMDEHWWEVPFGKVNRLAVVVGTAVPVLMHPQEAVAAAGLVFGRHVADGAQPQHLGLHFGARDHQSADRLLRGRQRPMVADVRERGSGRGDHYSAPVSDPAPLSYGRVAARTGSGGAPSRYALLF